MGWMLHFCLIFRCCIVEIEVNVRKQFANSPLIKNSYQHVFFHLHPSCPAAIHDNLSVVECVRWRAMLQLKNNRTNDIVHALLAKTALSTTSKLNVHWS